MNQNRKDKQNQEDEVATAKWQSEFTSTVVTEVYQLIKQQEELYGVEFGDKLRLSIIAGLTSTFVYEVLTSLPAGSGDIEAAAGAGHVVFTDLKEAIGTAVASGVEGGVRAWSGKELQYYCEISLEPAALNIEPC